MSFATERTWKFLCGHLSTLETYFLSLVIETDWSWWEITCYQLTTAAIFILIGAFISIYVLLNFITQFEYNFLNSIVIWVLFKESQNIYWFTLFIFKSDVMMDSYSCD